MAENHPVMAKFPVIDMHTHLGEMQDGSPDMDYDTGELVQRLRAQGIKKVVNLDFMYDDIRDRVLQKEKGYEDFFINFGAPDVSRFEELDFERTVRRQISENVNIYGMKGIKLWNNISFHFRDRTGRYIKPDDKRLGCIYELAAEFDIPVLYHIADVKAFFEKYCDRTFFGTDLNYHENPYPEYWRFLETFDEYFNPFGEDPYCLSGWNIYGIGLSDDALKKIYYENAEKLLKL